MEDAKPGDVRVLKMGPLGDVIAERGEGTKLLLRTIQAEHAAQGAGEPVRIPFREESDGTQRLTNLLPALFQLRQQQRVYVIDEIDRSLHPLLSRKFIEFFLSACKGHGSQIILTTHESNLWTWTFCGVTNSGSLRGRGRRDDTVLAIRLQDPDRLEDRQGVFVRTIRGHTIPREPGPAATATECG